MRLPLLCLAASLFALPALAQSEYDNPAPRGVLVPFGGYPSVQTGATIVPLKDGTVFSYGAGPAVNEFKTLAYQNATLRERRGYGNSTAPESGPRWYDSARGGWQRLELPPECKVGARYLHTATALADGKVLIAGGMCDVPKMGDDSEPQKAFAALSLWDGASHAWMAAPALATPRLFHSASLMADGSVIFVGGESDPALMPDQVLSAVERYANGKMTTLPPLLRARAKHSATVLANGELLVVGGFDAAGVPLASAELFNPATQSWQALPAPKVGRYSHSATLLDDGRVMVSGGIGADNRPVSATEVWDPRTQAWSAAADLPTPLFGHGAARVASGDVLVAGGAWINALGRTIPWAWRWNPRTDQWLLAGSAMPGDEATMSSPVVLVPQAGGEALVFTPASVLRWFPDANAPGASDAGFIFDKVLKKEQLAASAPRPAVAVSRPGLLGRIGDEPELRTRLLIAVAVPIVLFLLLRGRFRSAGGGMLSRVLLYGVVVAIGAAVIWPMLPKRAVKVPCGLVGVWSARNDRDHAVREVELKDDGSYTMGPSQLGIDPAGGYQGRWAVKEATMMWRDENGEGEADDNPMQLIEPGHFILTERNHSHTEFTLERAVASTSCKP